MATVVPNIEKPVTIYSKANELAKYISLNGNYQDILNAMTLLCRYARVFTTGQVPTIRKIRGGIEASSVAALESALTGATIQVNAIHDFNNMRDNFFRNVAIKEPGIYNYVASQWGTQILDRVCVERIVIAGEVDINDCEGTLIAKATDVESFLKIWNEQKVPADAAICGINTPYYFETYVNGYFGVSSINPNNETIPYNAVGIQDHRQRGEFDDNRRDIVDEEARVKPQSIAKYSDSEL